MYVELNLLFPEKFTSSVFVTGKKIKLNIHDSLYSDSINGYFIHLRVNFCVHKNALRALINTVYVESVAMKTGWFFVALNSIFKRAKVH